MEWRREWWLVLGLMMSLSCGCGEAAPGEGAGAPSERAAPEGVDLNDRVQEDKSDRGGPFVQMRGQLAVGQSGAGQFVRNGQHDAWVFDVLDESVVTLEITRRGSARDLDTMLYLYGPLSPDGRWPSRPSNSDDDDGYGDLSELEALRFTTGGRYLAMVGTADGMGRGDYRLELRCEGRTCAPTTQRLTPDAMERVELHEGLEFTWSERARRAKNELLCNIVGVPDSSCGIQLRVFTWGPDFVTDLESVAAYTASPRYGELEVQEVVAQDPQQVGVAFEEIVGALSGWEMDYTFTQILDDLSLWPSRMMPSGVLKRTARRPDAPGQTLNMLTYTMLYDVERRNVVVLDVFWYTDR